MSTNYARPTSLFAAVLTAVRRGQSLTHLIVAATKLYVVAVVSAHNGNLDAAARTAGLSTKTLAAMWRRALKD